MSTYQQHLVTFASDLKSALADESDRINKDQQIIKEYFGGFNVMLYLCLSNPNCNDFLNEESFISLKKLLESHKSGSKIDHDAEKATESPTSVVERKTSTIVVNSSSSGPTISNGAAVTSSNSNITKLNAVFFNLDEFHTYSMAIMADPYNNFYHTSLKLSLDHTRFILDKILFSKWFFLCFLAIFILLYLASQIYWSVTGHVDFLYVAMYFTAQLIPSVTATSYVLSANIDIVLSLLQTFDFWYKMYNMTIAIVSVRFLDYYANWITYFITQTTLLSIAVGMCLFDAICISNTKKWILNISVIGVLIYVVVYVYFQSKNVYWNPFGSKYTQIDVKSLVISSYINVIIFILKPMFGTFGQWFKNMIQNKSCTRIKHGKDEKWLQRSYFLHKRPMIKWHDASHQENWCKESQRVGNKR